MELDLLVSYLIFRHANSQLRAQKAMESSFSATIMYVIGTSFSSSQMWF